MDAVLRVDLEPRMVVAVANDLIDASRAVALRRFGIDRQVDVDRDVRIGQHQMHGLIFFVIGRREGHVGQLVKGQLAVGTRIIDRLELAGLAGRLGIGLAVLQRVAEANRRQ